MFNMVSVARLIGVSAIALVLCASAPIGALAQATPSMPDASAPGAAAPLPGASIRKPPSAAAGGGSAAADSTAASSSSSSANATPSAAAGGEGANAGSEPGTAESGSGAPAALATPSSQVRKRTKAAHRAHPDNAAQSASAKTKSKDATAGSKDDTNGNGQQGPFSALQFSGNKGPIDIKSDTLDLDYKGNVVTFRGHVRAAQADAILTSDTLKVSYGKDFHEVKEMVANNNVRMSQGTRWATGDHAVLDQAKHTVTLTGSPVVHDGEDQVTGSKITVHLDTGKSEVEGARAVFFPKEQKTRDNKTTVAKSP